MEATFCVIELPGVAADARATSDGPAAVLRTLCAQATATPRQVVRERPGQSILAVLDPAAALELARELLETAQRLDAPVRLGLHRGDAVRRGDAWFGSAINVAVRVCAHARTRQVLATAGVARTAADIGLAVDDAGTFEIQDVIGPLALYAIDVSPQPPALDASARDPVCGCEIAQETAAGMLRYQASEHWFCSLECAAAFAADPQRYVG